MRNLNLLVLRCADLERSRAFYEQLLQITFSQHAHGNGPLHYAHEDPAAAGVLELYPAKSPTPDPTALGFACPDLEQTHGRLTQLGLNPSPIQSNPWGVSFTLKDPENRRIELTQPPASNQ